MALHRSLLIMASLTSLLFGSQVLADGTEVLGTPSIAIASGTGITTGGSGLLEQPATIEVEVPAGASGTVAIMGQVLYRTLAA